MSEAKHTPGPWEIDVANSHSGQIATLHGAETALGEPTWLEIWSIHWPYTPSTVAANARLIAEAPAMFKLLELLEEAIGREPGMIGQNLVTGRGMIQLLLAKIEGES